MTGKVSSQFRAAVIISRFSSEHAFFFALQRIASKPVATSDFCFPSLSIELGCTGRETAIKVIDCWLGTGFRQGGQLPDDIVEPFHLCPVVSRAVHHAEKSLTFVGVVGNTLYYDCNLPGGLDFRASAHASRRKVNGFRLTATQETKHPSGDVFRHTAVPLLSELDAVAWEQLLCCRAGTESFEEPGWAQHSEPTADSSTQAASAVADTGGGEPAS